MKPVFCTIAALFITVILFAQTSIKLTEVSQHIGDSVTVCGNVDDLRFFENSKNQPTFVNVGGKFPNQLLTLVIWGDVRKQFTGKVDDLKNKNICITGRIILYKEKPEIIIDKPEQVVAQ